MSGKMIRATFEGRTYEIPEICIIGYRQANPGWSILDAIAHWAYQTQLGEQEDEQG